MRTLLRLPASAAAPLASSGALLAAPFAYNSGSNDVSAIDTATDVVVARIAVDGSRNGATSPYEVRP